MKRTSSYSSSQVTTGERRGGKTSTPRCALVFLQLHLQRTSVSEGESWEHPTKPPFLPQDLIDVHLFLTSFQRQREGTGRKSRRLHLHQGDGEVAGFRDGRVVGSRRRRRRRRMLRGHEPGHGPWRSPWRMRQDSGEGRQLGRRLRWTVQSVGLYLRSSHKVGGATLRGPAFGLS